MGTARKRTCVHVSCGAFSPDVIYSQSSWRRFPYFEMTTMIIWSQMKPHKKEFAEGCLQLPAEHYRDSLNLALSQKQRIFTHQHTWYKHPARHLLLSKAYTLHQHRPHTQKKILNCCSWQPSALKQLAVTLGELERIGL